MLAVLYLLVDRSLTVDNSPVLQSQTLDWILIQKKRGIKTGLICTVQNFEDFEEIAGKKLRDNGIPYYLIANGSLVGNLIKGIKGLWSFNKSYESSFVYVRGVWGAVIHRITFLGRKSSLIYDFRGDIISESTFLGSGGIRVKALKKLVKWAIGNADKVCCVSDEASKLLSREYKRDGAEIIPSGVDCEKFFSSLEKRSTVRKSLKVSEEEILLVYAGGLSKYQMIPEMLNIWSSLQPNPQIKFLLLTSGPPNSPSIREALLHISKHRINVLTLPRKEVPNYLAASDIGFFLRRNDGVNRVASPVKLGEYLASGLAIITSPGIGESSELIVKNNVGLLLRPENVNESAKRCQEFISQVAAQRDDYGDRSRETAKRYLDWSAHIEKWRVFLGVNG